MNILIFSAVACLTVSMLVDRKKTLEGLKHGVDIFSNLLPTLLTLLPLVSIIIYLLPEKTIIEFLGAKSGALGVMIAAVVGAIAIIPPFIAFPLAKILISKGVSYSVVAVFMTNLIMIGMVSLPMEFKYFGKRATILRNLLTFIGAIIIGLLVGVFM